MTTLTPLYRCVREVLHKRKEEVRDTGVRVARTSETASIEMVSVGAAYGPRRSLCTAALYDRDGIYDDPEAKRQHGDNPIRFMFLCHAAMQLGQHLPEVFRTFYTRMTGKLLCSHS